MRNDWTWRMAAATALCCSTVVGVVGCGDAKQAVSDASDELAERGVAAYAEGRWRCENVVDDGGRQEVSAIVAIGGEGRFSYEVVGRSNPQVGTWAIEGLELRLSVPWYDDGSNGFYEWTHEADADPPTHLSGREQRDDGFSGSIQDIDIDIDLDVADHRIHLVQRDDGAEGGTNYSWDATCTRESSDPGAIPNTVPPATRED